MNFWRVLSWLFWLFVAVQLWAAEQEQDWRWAALAGCYAFMAYCMRRFFGG